MSAYECYAQPSHQKYFRQAAAESVLLSGETALRLAIERGYESIAMLLLDKQAEVRYCCPTFPYLSNVR